MKKRIFIWVTLVLFIASAVGCASIFHSERMGNSSGRLDIGMCILGIFFFWPISWIVDLCTGAIWIEDSSGNLRMPDGSPVQFTDANPGGGRTLAMPASGKFSYSLPVRGDGTHVVDFRLLTEDGSIAASDRTAFCAESEWKNIESTLTVSAGKAVRGTLNISVDGTRRVAIPVEFVQQLD